MSSAENGGVVVVERSMRTPIAVVEGAAATIE